MILNKQAFEQEGTRLLVGNVPYSVRQDEFMQAFAAHGTVQSGFLSRTTLPNRNNAGWGIVSLDEETARNVLVHTVVIAGRVAKNFGEKPVDDYCSRGIAAPCLRADVSTSPNAFDAAAHAAVNAGNASRVPNFSLEPVAAISLRSMIR